MTVCECNKFEMVDNSDVFYMLREGSTSLVFDPVPIQGSTNLLTSGAVYNALEVFSVVNMSFVDSGLVITIGGGLT